MNCKGKQRWKTPGKRVIRLAAGLAGVSLLALLPAEAAEIPFASGVDIATSLDGAVKVIAADIDGDGALDAVVTVAIDDEVRWYRNVSGDGSTWSSFAVDSSFDGAADVQAIDIDLDGDLDLLAAARDGNDVHWWENDGTPTDDTTPDAGGNFWAEHVIDTGFSGARAVAGIDLDGDGDPDVVAAGETAGDISWWENDGSPGDDVGGDGNSWTEHPIDSAFGGAAAVFVVDIDCDGDLDVVGGAAIDDAIHWWENDGTPTDNTTDDGSGNYWTEHVIESAFDEVRAVFVADYDHDGDPDVLAAAATDGDLKWWENDGSPADDTGGDGNSWTEHTLDGAFAGAADVRAVDLDRDGDLDVLAAARTDNDVVWYETGGTPPGGPLTKRPVFNNFGGASSAVAADLDGDGDFDILGAAFSGDKIAWWKNQTIHGSAFFPTAQQILPELLTGYEVALGDIDKDGDLDIVNGQGSVPSSKLNWWENSAGDGSTWTERLIGLPSQAPEEVEVGDLDGDGDLDVIANVLFGGVLAWWENDGTPADGAWTSHQLNPTTGKKETMDLVDLDADGDLDLVYPIGPANLVAWIENDGSGCSPGCAWPERPIDDDFTGALRIATADIDRDGDLDVVGLSANLGTTVWWENDGTPADNTTDDGVGNYWTEHGIAADTTLFVDMTVGDVDGDGDLDVIGSRFNSLKFEITWWENDGSPTNDTAWTSHAVPNANPFENFLSVHVQVGDFDRDGDLDIVAKNSGPTNQVAWFRNEAGDGSTWTELAVLGTLQPDGLEVGDLDRDGYLDLVLQQGGATMGEIEWLPNLGGQFSLATTDTSPGGILAGETREVLRVEAQNLGRTGDSAAELATLELLFEETVGDPLSTVEAAALLTNLHVYLDDGSGSFDISDSLVISSGSPVLTSGVLTLVLTDGAADVQLAAGTPRTYFLVLEVAGGAAAATPNAFLVTHLTEASSTAEDAPADIPLRMEFASNVSTAAITAQDTCLALTLSSSAYGADPVAAPANSGGCPTGQFVAGALIGLTAAPDPGFLIDSWMGTNDDSSIETTNALTMPGAAHTVTVNYIFPDVIVIEAPYSIGADETKEACTAIKVGDTDGSGGTSRVIVNNHSLLTLRAGIVIEFYNLFEVLNGGELVVENTTFPQCP